MQREGLAVSSADEDEIMDRTVWRMTRRWFGGKGCERRSENANAFPDVEDSLYRANAVTFKLSLPKKPV